MAEPLKHGTDTKAEIFHTRGGSAANVASFAGRLGPTRFIGCVGDDFLGDSLVKGLEAEGVDVRVQRAGSTGTIVILIDETGERSMLPHRGASTLLSEVPDEWLDGLRLLHVPAYSFNGEPVGATTIEVIRRAKAKGIQVSIDASSTGMLSQYGVQRFLDLLVELRPDFLIGNESESTFLGLTIDGLPGPNASLLPETIVVTKAGADPTVVHQPGADVIVVAVPPVTDVRDLTGAGDAFAAGFLASYLLTHDLRVACEGGHAAAARVLTSPGASISAA
ncbi:carbohydrate kinase family protein [Glaciibacter psychrotolerans]|uniref:Sugar/nucleoside kinase (Ribokinase family) n=1 Tax=Glaciibacter psychrotolerans TaxID=670054 RepID=A0A7Z0ECW7_9MICO|nr:PfkB family carbohydrate kinase [Leifsonia psychrotolerans]NYJ18704.1 sugar/nucleoside kinase (ribokinase family) [Leifsonia psychrotolerans]